MRFLFKSRSLLLGFSTILGIFLCVRVAAQPPFIKRLATQKQPAYNGERNTLHVSPMQINFSGNGLVTAHRTIENTSDTSVTFVFAGLPTTKHELIDSFIAQLSTPADVATSRRELALHIVPAWLKSNRWRNEALIWNGFSKDSISYQRQTDPMGMLYSINSAQCGNYAEVYKALLIETGYFKLVDFHQIALVGHSIVEVFIDGGWALVDNDPGTPFLYAENPANPNGIATAADIYSDTSLISKSSYNNGVHQPTYAMDIDRYMAIWADGGVPSVWHNNYYVIDENVTGNFILPPHSIITAPLVTVGYLDSSLVSTQQALAQVNVFLDIVATGQCDSVCQSAYADSVAMVIQALLPQLTIAEVRDYMDQGTLVLYNSITDQGQMLYNEVSRDEVPYWEVAFTTADTLSIGRQLQFPLLVLEAQQPCLLEDTTITQSAVFTLWDSETPPEVSFMETNYMDKGLVYPGNNLFNLAVNENVISRVQGWNLRSDNDMQPIVNNHITFTSGYTAMAGVEPEEPWRVYPNPATNVLNICSPGTPIEQFTITNLLGETVITGRPENGYNIVVNTVQLAQGLYIIRAKAGSKELVNRFTRN
jgi:hypothetical protein